MEPLDTKPSDQQTKATHPHEAELHEVALDGLISTPQLRTLGYEPPTLRRLCRDGVLRRVIRGWYEVPALTRPGHELPPYERAELDHKILTMALVRSFEGRAAASRQSAIVLLGGRTWKADLELAHLDRVGDDHSRHRKGAVLHPRIAPFLVNATEGFQLGGGYVCVPPAVAAVQVGLADSRGVTRARPLESLIAAEGFLWSKAMTRAELDEAVELRHASGGSETVGETRCMYQCRGLGYELEQQAPIPGTPYLADALLKGERVIIEFDGRVKYAEDVASGLREGGVLWKEKRRQDQLNRLGYEVVRITWDVLNKPHEILRRIEAARARARGIA